MEDYIQDNRQLINCFINNLYTFKPVNDIPLLIVINFYQFLQGLGPDKQKIVFDNIDLRLSNIHIEIEIDIDDDDLPF